MVIGRFPLFIALCDHNPITDRRTQHKLIATIDTHLLSRSKGYLTFGATAFSRLTDRYTVGIYVCISAPVTID